MRIAAFTEFRKVAVAIGGFHFTPSPDGAFMQPALACNC